MAHGDDLLKTCFVQRPEEVIKMKPEIKDLMFSPVDFIFILASGSGKDDLLGGSPVTTAAGMKATLR